MNFNDRVVRRMSKLGLSQSGLARTLHTRQSTIQQIVAGETRSFRKPQELAVALQTNIEWLLTGEGHEEIQNKKSINEFSGQSRIAGVIAESPSGQKMIPVYGLKKTANGIIVVDYSEPVDWKSATASQDYGTYAPDSTMAPRHKQGELVRINPWQPLTNGHDCWVEMLTGEVYLKIFVKETSKELICEQLCPPQEWRRKISDIRKISAVVR